MIKKSCVVAKEVEFQNGDIDYCNGEVRVSEPEISNRLDSLKIKFRPFFFFRAEDQTQSLEANTLQLSFILNPQFLTTYFREKSEGNGGFKMYSGSYQCLMLPYRLLQKVLN